MMGCEQGSKAAFSVRQAKVSDIPALMDIFKASGVTMRRMDLGEYIRCWHGVVASEGGRIVAVALYALDGSRITVDRLMVDNASWEHGAMEAVLEPITSSPFAARIVVRETHLLTQKRLSATGWRAVGVVREAFEGTDEDGIEFRFRREDGISEV